MAITEGDENRGDTSSPRIDFKVLRDEFSFDKIWRSRAFGNICSHFAQVLLIGLIPNSCDNRLMTWSCSIDRLCLCVFAYLCRVFACNTPKDVSVRVCVRMDIWWWWWRFWWSITTRLLEINRSMLQGNQQQNTKSQNVKKTKRQIRNTRCKYKIQIAKKKWKIYHLKKNRFFDFLRFSRKKWCLRRTAVTFERKFWH